METTARPLYLDASNSLHVSKRGPSLTVRDSRGRQRWYPLGRVSRIVCRGRVEWSPGSLQACMERGIGILILDSEGEVMALHAPRKGSPLTLGERLATAMASPQWAERFDNWIRSQDRRLMNNLCDATKTDRSEDSSALWTILVKRLSAEQGTDAAERMELLYGPLNAHVNEAMGHAGIGPLERAGWNGDCDLLDELVTLLRWPLIGRVLQYRVPLPRDAGSAVHYYEYVLSRRLDPAIRRLVAYLWKIPL